MKFELLHLLRFGPLTDMELELGHPGPALHVLYGPNEAGKSTTLRAIHGLLYGIPDRSLDTHLHGPDLRVRARLSDAQGHTLELVRRKGRKNTLLGTDGEPLAEGALARFLGGVDERLFESMYGLDHESLRRGAEALLSDGGAVGESLFEVGIGGRGVHRVLQQLRDEADAIFVPRASKRRLNDAISAFRDANRRAASEALRTDVYEAQQRAIERGERDLSQLRERRRTLSEERGRLQRALSVAGPLSQRRVLCQRLSELDSVVILPDGAREERVEAMATVARSEPEIRQLRVQLSKLQDRRDALEIPESLADLGEDTVQAVRDQLGSHRKAAADLPRRKEQLRLLQSEARTILRRLGWSTSLSDMEQYRVPRAEIARIRALSRRRDGLEQALEHAREQVSGLSAALALNEEKRGQLPEEPEQLAQALTEVRRLGDFRTRRRQLAGELARRRAQLTEALASVQPAVGSLAELPGLPLPLPASVQRHDEQERRWADELRQSAQTEASVVAELARVERELSALRGEGDVPSEAELSQRRAARDDWFAQRGPKTPPTPAALGALQGLIADADALADRLRREAGRVTKLAHLMAARAGLLAQQERAAETQARLRAELAQAREAFVALFAPCGVTPLSPGEMGHWLRTVEALREQARELASRADELAALDAQLEALVHALSSARADAATDAATGDPAERLDGLLARVERERAERARRLEQQQLATQRGEQLRADLVVAQERLSRHAEALSTWRAQWAAGMAPLSLAPDATVEQADAVLEELVGLFDKVDDIEKLQGRIEGMERDTREFEKTVRRLTDRHLFKLGEYELEEAAEELSAAYTRARRDREERTRIDREMGDLEAKLSQLLLDHERASETLASLCRRAGVRGVEQLEAAERASERRVALQRDLSQVDAALSQASDGLSLPELAAEAAAWPADRARARMEDLERETEQLDQTLERVTHELVAAQEAQSGYTSKEGAAAAAADAAAHAEATRTLVYRYARLRLAERLLEREIQRYRKRHQAPILKAADGFFVRLTLGRYSGLSVDYLRGDEPVLCAVRDGVAVTVDGLSDGTRDQLYLALRLATLARQAERAEPLPLVLDDILIHFDDERARAALSVLGEFTAITQVLFFTHHARLLELAREAVDPSVLREHRLESRSALPVQGMLL